MTEAASSSDAAATDRPSRLSPHDEQWLGLHARAPTTLMESGAPSPLCTLVHRTQKTLNGSNLIESRLIPHLMSHPRIYQMTLVSLRSLTSMLYVSTLTSFERAHTSIALSTGGMRSWPVGIVIVVAFLAKAMMEAMMKSLTELLVLATVDLMVLG